MTAIRDLINKLRADSYYVRLMEILVINGLLDIFEEEIRDGKIDYLPLVLNLIKFLEKNKKHYRNFSSDTFENIIILSIDEIINKKFQINLEEEQLKMVLELVKNSYLFKSTITFVKDFLIKMYYKCKCKSCYSSSDVIIELDKSRHPNV
tara:strand:- start:20695 stop:21144 length:450 start_codon:yes stop_codon:yes gene_type:complete